MHQYHKHHEAERDQEHEANHKVHQTHHALTDYRYNRKNKDQSSATRTHRTTTLTYDINAHNEIEPKMKHWDGSPETNTPASSQVFYQAYLNSKARELEMGDIPEPQLQDNSSSDEFLSISRTGP